MIELTKAVTLKITFSLNIIFQSTFSLSLSTDTLLVSQQFLIYFESLYFSYFRSVRNLSRLYLRILQRNYHRPFSIDVQSTNSWYLVLFVSFAFSTLSSQATVNSSKIICFVGLENMTMSERKVVSTTWSEYFWLPGTTLIC